jgi:NitT/TauT family transport system permease protein
VTAPSFFHIDAKPGRWPLWTLSWVLFVSGALLYFYVAAQRHRENPDDKVMPSLAQLSRTSLDAMSKPAEEDDDGSAAASGWFARLHTSMLWKDTAASTRRFAISLALLVPAVLLGLHMGLFPYVGAFFQRFVLFFDKIVALSLLPILFIAFGIDELSKIMLIIIGVAPTIILDTVNLSRSVPREQLVKAFTLGSSSFGVTYLVVLKQILPRVINSIRLNLKPLMLFLFAGEMIASTDGLAYRIALARRHLAMDLIVPYVLWVALLLFLTDWLLRALNRSLHPWFQEG